MIKPKGTNDFYKDINKYNYIITVFKQLCELQGYNQIITPHFEYKNLFINSDNKEMFFIDDKYALRPEGTASVVRAYLENKFWASNENKFYYVGSMFRNDNPQKGRYKEFTQLGIELFNQFSYLSDIEVIYTAYEFLNQLQIKNTLHINTIGCNKCRQNYINVLTKYLQSKQLCTRCQNKKNILRVLDCKQCSHQFIDDVPHIIDYVCNDCLQHFYSILSSLNIPYIINYSLVRGLDYYTNTVFEFKCNQLEAAQSTVIGGGRYNDLIKLKGNSIPAVGFAAGLERLMLLINLNRQEKDYVYVISQNYKKEAIQLYQLLIHNDIPTQINYTTNNLTKQLKQAKNNTYVIIIEEDEILNNCYTVKNMKQHNQIQISKDVIVPYLKEKLK